MTEYERRVKKSKENQEKKKEEEEKKKQEEEARRYSNVSQDVQRRLKAREEATKPYTVQGTSRRNAYQNRTESLMNDVAAAEPATRRDIERYKAVEDSKYYANMNKRGTKNRDQSMVNRSVKGYEESYQRWKKVYDANKGPAAIDLKTSRQSEIRAQAQKIQRYTDTGTGGKDAREDDKRWAGVTDRLKHLGSMQRNVDTPGAKKNYSEEFHPDQVRKQYREAYEQAFPSGQTAKQTSVTDRYSAAEQKLRTAERDAYYWEQAAKDAAWFGDEQRFTRSLPHITESGRRAQGALAQFRAASDEMAGAVRDEDEKLKQGDLATWYARNLSDDELRRRLEEEKSRDVSVTDRDRAENPGMYPDAAFRTMPRQASFDPTMTAGGEEPGNRFYMTEEEKQLTEQSDRYLLQQKVNDREVQIAALERAQQAHHERDLEQEVYGYALRGHLSDMAKQGQDALRQDMSNAQAHGSNPIDVLAQSGSAEEALALFRGASAVTKIWRNLMKCSDDQKERVYAMYSVDPQKAVELSQKYYDDAMDAYYAQFYNWANSKHGLQAGRRLAAGLLGTGAKLLSGFDPFGDAGQDLSRVGEAFIGGASESASRNGLFGIEVLGGDESPISGNVPFIGRGRAGEAVQLGTSMLESAGIAVPAMLIGRYDTAAAKVANFLGTTLMGSSAAADDYRECLSLGMSDSQALWHATAAGVAEAAFEYISLDKLIDPANIKHGLLRMLTQGGIEASEEVCTTIANRISDTVIANFAGTKNAIEREALEYQLHGMSAEEAERKAQNQWLAGLMMDGLGGLFSGIIMGGGSDILQRGIARLNTTINTAEENTGRGYLTGLETAGYTDTDTLDALTGYARANGIDVKGLTDAQAKAAVSDQGAAVSGQETQGAETGNSQEAIGNSGRETTDRVEDGTPLIRQPEGLTPSPEGEGFDGGLETKDGGLGSARPTETKEGESAQTRSTENGEANENGEKPRLSKRELRRAGKVRSQIVESIAQKFEGLTAAEKAAQYDSLVEQYGSGIEAVASEALYNASRQDMRTVTDVTTLEQRHGTDAAAFTSETARQTMERAYRDTQQIIMRETGDTTRSSMDSLAALNRNLRKTDGATLNLQAEVTGEDGGTKTVSVRSFDNEGKRVVLEDGSKVDVKDLTTDADTKSFLQAMQEAELGEYTNEAFQTFLDTGTEQTLADGIEWITGYRGAFGVGEVRGNITNAIQLAARYGLDTDTAAAAYYQGVKASDALVAQSKQTLAKAQEMAKSQKQTVTGRRSTIDVSAIEGVNMTNEERRQFNFANKIFSMIGVELRWVASDEKNGRFVGANGSYLHGVVTLDIHAGRNFLRDVNSGILATTGHELTHFLQEYAPEQYRAVKEFLFQQIVQGSANGEAMLERLIWEKQRRASSKLSRRAAQDEVVADACQTMLRDSKAIREFAQQDEEAAKGIARWLDKWFGKLKQAISRSAQLTEEARFVDSFAKEVREAFGKLWDEALWEAVETHDRVGNIEKTQQQNSDRDAEYLELAKDPEKNRAKLQEMVDEAAKRAGYTAKGYHVGAKGITKFGSGNFAGLIYFAKTEKDARIAARSKKSVYECYLSMQNPVNTEKTAIPWYEAEDNLKVGKWKRAGYDSVFVKDEAGISMAVFDNKQIKSADPVTYDDSGNVIPLSERFNTENQDIRYSEREEYLELAKDPEKNAAKLQEMVDEAARKAGYTIKAYHGTAKSFTVFDKSFSNKHNDSGRGFYFTSDQDEAQQTYADVSAEGDMRSKIEEEVYARLSDEGISYEDTLEDEGFDRYNEVYDEVVAEMERDAHVESVYLKINNPLVIEAGSKIGVVALSGNADLIEAEVKKGNYDGIIDRSVKERFKSAKGTHYIVFDSNQAKRSAPVTYDDNGNVIPLSERFNEANEDIRFSGRPTTDSTGRELSEGQKEYFKDSKAMNKDGNLLILYHGGPGMTVFRGRESSTFSKNAIYMTDEKEIARAYAGTRGKTQKLYANITNPLVLDAQGRNYTDIPIPPDAPQSLLDYFWYDNTADLDNLPVYAEENGYDGVIVYNVRESVGGGPMTEVVAFQSNQVKTVDNLNPTDNPDIRYSERDYSTPSDVDLVMGMDEKDADTPEGKTLIREVQAKQKQIETLLEKLAEAKRQLTTTKRALNTKGIGNVAGNVIRDFGISDAGGKNIKQQATEILTDVYQKALDQIDSGATAAEAWETVYNGAVEAANLLIDQGRYTENNNGKWTNVPYSQYIGEDRQTVIDQMVSEAAVDFSRNRYRGPIQETAADRLVARTEKRMQGKLDETKAKNAALKAENERLEQDNTFLKDQADGARFAAGNLYDQVKDLRQELKDNRKLTAQERKSLQGKIDRLNKQIEAKKAEAAAWRDRANRNASLLKSALESKSRDIQTLKAENQRQVDRAVAEKDAVVRKLEAQIEREQQILAGKLKPPAMQKMLKEARETAAAEMQERKNAQFQRMREGRKASELRKRIKNLSDEMKRRMTRPTDGAYVPASLYGSMTKLADVLDTVLAPNPGTKAETRYRSMMDAIHSLAAEYDGIKNLDDYAYSSEFDQEIRDQISELERVLNKDRSWADELTGDRKHVGDLKVPELQQVFDILRQINQTMKNAAKLMNNQKLGSLYDAMRNVADQQAGMRSRNASNAFTRGMRNWRLDTMSTMRAVEKMSGWDRNAALYQLMQGIEQGVVDSDIWMMNYNKRMEALKTGKNELEYRKALSKKLDYGVKDTKDGIPVMMTKLQALQILMTAEREASNDKLVHLQKGGAEIRDAVKIQEGKAAKAASYHIDVTPELIQKIRDSLTEWDKQYMQTVHDYFKTESREMNKILYSLKNRVLETEEAYVPYIVDSNYLETKLDSADAAMNMWVKTPGSTNALKTKASQPVIIDGMDTVMAKHVRESADYIGLALPIRDFAKVYNGMLSQGEDQIALPVKKTIADNWGDKGVKILTDAVRDVQGSARAGSYNTAIAAYLNKLQSGFVKSALLINPSVTIKQAASYIAAESVISHRALIAGNRPLFNGQDASRSPSLIAQIFAAPSGSTATRIYNEIDEHTSMHYQRRQGMSYTELANEANRQGWLKRNTGMIGARMEQNAAGHFVRKAGQALNPVQWIQRMDVATTAALWVACKEQAKMDGMEAGTNEYWSHVTELYEQTLRETQPMYDNLHRTNMQKEKTGLMQFLFPFRTVPVQNHGQIAASFDAMLAAKGKGKEVQGEAVKHFIKTVWAQTESAVVFSVMTFLAAGLKRKTKNYRDEDDEISPESILKGILNDAGGVWLSNILPMTGSELWSWGSKAINSLKGVPNGYTFDTFSVGVVDMLNDLSDAADRMFKAIGKAARGEISFKEFSETGDDFLATFAKLAGIPATTIKTYAEGLWGDVQDIREGRIPAFNDEAVERKNSTNARRFTKAWNAKDEAKMDKVLDEMFGNKVRTSDAAEGARDALSAAAKEAYQAGKMDMEEYVAFLKRPECFTDKGITSRITDRLKEDFIAGKRSAEETVELLLKYKDYKKNPEQSAWSAVKEWAAKAEFEKENGEDADDDDFSFSQYDELNDAVAADENVTAEIQELKAHGYTDKQINDALQDSIKKAFKDGTYTEEEAIDALVRYGATYSQNGKTVAFDKDKAWQTVREWAAKAGHEDEEGHLEEGYSYSLYDGLREAVTTGKGIEAAMKELTDHGVKASAVNDELNKTVLKLYTDGTITEKTAIGLLTKYHTVTKNKQTRLQTADEAWAALREASAKAAHTDEDGHLEDDYSYNKYEKIDAALDKNGDISKLVKELTDHGEKQENITKHIKSYLLDRYVAGQTTEKALKNQLSRYCGITKTDEVEKILKDAGCEKDCGYGFDELKNAYGRGDLSEANAKKMLRKYGGLTDSGAAHRIGYWDYCRKNPDTQIKAEAWDTYYEKQLPTVGGTLSSRGMKLSSFTEYREKRAQLEVTDLDGDGKKDEKAYVLNLINSMKLSTAEKDMLYYYNGYGARELWKTPWH